MAGVPLWAELWPVGCVSGSVLFTLPLACVLCRSQDGFLFSVSIASGLICIILAVIKFMLGKVLTSRALITDGTCTRTAPPHVHVHAFTSSGGHKPDSQT